MRDNQPVEQGQILVEWDPYTFSILTEDAGTVKYKDLVSDVTFHEEVDEVTGLSRKIVVDSPDEQKQPMIEVVPLFVDGGWIARATITITTTTNVITRVAM